MENVIALLDTNTVINADDFNNRQKAALFIAVCGLDFLDALDYTTYECDGEELTGLNNITEMIKHKIKIAYTV